MFDYLRQVQAGNLALVFGVVLALAGLILVVSVRLGASARRSHDRRMLIALVLEMLERDVEPADVTAVLRAMRLQRFDERFSAARRRLYRRYARRRAAARAASVTPPPAERELQAVGQWESPWA